MERRTILAAAAVFFCGALVFAGEAIPNWPAPAARSPSRSPGRVAALDVTNPLPFIGLAPCRILDTRGNGFSGAFGPPALVASASRNFPLSGRCGIPSGAEAVSLNVTVTNTQGPGFILMYPQGGTQPLVSTLNYVAGQTVANAAVVPLGTGGGVSVVAGVSGTDLVIDTNGYYASAPANQATTFAVSVNNPGGTAMSASNSSEFCSQRCGISAVISSSNSLGAYALTGSADGLTGPNIGVLGFALSGSAGTAGVYGAAGSNVAAQSSYARSGVRGESFDGYGVLGVSRSNGVGAALVNSGGSQLVYALLAAAGTPNYAVFAGGDFGGIGAKYFVEPHPEDAAKVIRYVCLEGPESGTYFRGRGTFVHGRARITVPESFRMVSDDEGLTVQITPIGEPVAVAVTRMSLDGIEARATGDVEFSYLVHGVRRAFKNHEPIAEGTEFRPSGPDEKMPAYLTEEAKKRLIANGTYNADGTVNRVTADRVGWTRFWAERERAATASAQPQTNGPRP